MVNGECFNEQATPDTDSQTYQYSFRGLEPDEERLKEFISTLDQKLDGYETILGKQRFLAGNVGDTIFSSTLL